MRRLSSLAALLCLAVALAACIPETPPLPGDVDDPINDNDGARAAAAIGAGSSVLPSCTSSSATQPAPPSSGPGSAGSHALWLRSYGYGFRPLVNRTYLYLPRAPAAKRAPIVIYLPGYGGSSAGDLVYRNMLVHLARKGFAVMYVTYGGLVEPWRYEDNALRGIRLGLRKLKELANWGIVDPDFANVALMGHSLGTIISARLATRAKSYGLPVPKALVLHDAEGESAPTIRQLLSITDLSGIAASTKIVFLSAPTSLRETSAGEVSNETVAKIFHNSSAVPATNKVLLVVPSDDHGCPAMISDHLGCLGLPGFLAVDAVDTWGYRRFSEAALRWAFDGSHAEYFVGNKPERTFLGTWSDGVAAEKMRIDVAAPKPGTVPVPGV
ncbi:MAG: hypothetical protein KC503_18740 [Myxococcales bacterium]|nr:hypothetical protein [Myxococcales bacterium]